eukprot:PhM_4_TR12858/c0_g1_i1/m.81772/K15075/MET18, MMS19; DNA repair/transcription protein MET18/MMS19
MDSALETFCTSRNPTQSMRADVKTNVIEPIKTGALPILTLVHALQKYLTDSTNEQVRINATEIMSDAIVAVESINDVQRQTLFDFMLGRISDYECVESVVVAIKALVEKKGGTSKLLRTPPDNATRLASALVTDVRLQYLRVQPRRLAFDLILTLVSDHTQQCVALGKAFVVNLVRNTDGERDPANVLATFRIYEKVLASFPVGVLMENVEDLFDAVSCYFPMAFAPSTTKDTAAVTRENLCASLHNCLASPLFAEHALPFLVDKLASTIVDTKLDALDVIYRCATETYTREELFVAVVDIIDTIRMELVRFEVVEDPDNEELLRQMLRVVEAVSCRAFGPSGGGSPPTPDEVYNSLMNLVQASLTSCEPDIVNVGHSRAHASIIHKLGAGAPLAAEVLFRRMQVLLYSAFLESELSPPAISARQKECVMLLVGGILAGLETQFAKATEEWLMCASASECARRWSMSDYLAMATACLDAPATSLLEACGVEAAGCLVGIAVHTNFVFLEEATILELVRVIVNVHMNVPDESVAVAALRVLNNVARVSLDIAMDKIFPEWCRGLEAKPSNARILFGMCTMMKLSPRLADKLASFLVNAAIAPSGPAAASAASSYLESVQEVMLATIESTTEANVFGAESSCPALVKTYVDMTRAAAAAPTTNLSKFDGASAHVALVRHVLTAMNAPFMAAARAEVSEYVAQAVADATDVATWSPTFLATSCAVVAAAANELDPSLLAAAGVNILTYALLRENNNNNILLTRDIAAASLGHMANKARDPNMFTGNTLLSGILVALSAEAMEQNHIHVLAAVARGALMRGDTKNGDAACERLHDTVVLSKNTAVRDCAISAVRVLLEPQDVWFHRAHQGVKAKVLWDQRLHSLTLQRVLHTYNNTSDNETKASMLLIVGHLTQNARAETLMNDVGAVVPLLLQATSTFMHNQSIVDSAMTALSALLRQMMIISNNNNTSTTNVFFADIMRENLDGIVNAALMCLHASSNMRVSTRRRAAEVLGSMPKWLPFSLIGSKKEHILDGTKRAMDDTKRVVRQEVQKCRDGWFLFEAAANKS